MRAARADPSPALLVAPEIAPAGCRLPRCKRLVLCDEKPRHIRKGAPSQVAQFF
jgi:hypothetical protein